MPALSSSILGPTNSGLNDESALLQSKTQFLKNVSQDLQSPHHSKTSGGGQILQENRDILLLGRSAGQGKT